jgi:hypothetical protein
LPKTRELRTYTTAVSLLIMIVYSLFPMLKKRERNGLADSDQTTGRTTEEQGFDFWQGRESFIFSKPRGPALEPPQPPTQKVSVACSPWIKRTGREGEHSNPSSVEVMNKWSYTSAQPQDFVEQTGTILLVYFTSCLNILLHSVTRTCSPQKKTYFRN